MAWSKEQKSEYMKKWREEHKAQIKKRRREYYLESLLNGKYQPPSNEYIREQGRRWREKNREHYNAYYREYHKKRRALLKGDL